MSCLHLLLFLFLILATQSIDSFKTNREKVNCIKVCHVSVTACLKDHQSPCSKAYVKCHQASNFITCLEEAADAGTKDITQCMRKDCKEEPKEQQKVAKQGKPDTGMEFRKFKQPVILDQKADIEQNQDKNESSDKDNNKKGQLKTEDKKDGNRRL